MTFSVMKVISISAMNADTLVAGITSFSEASSLLALVSKRFESVGTVTRTASIAIDRCSAPTVYTFIDLVSSTSTTSWVTFEADIIGCTSLSTCCVTFYTFVVEVKELIPVTFIQTSSCAIE